MEVTATQSPNAGFVPRDVIGFATNRTGSAVAKGDLSMFDMVAAVQAETTIYKPTGDTVSLTDRTSATTFGNCVAPVAETTAAVPPKRAWYGIWLEAVADNATGKIQVQGIVEQAMVKRSAGSGTIATGDPLIAAATEDLDATFSGTVDIHQRVLGTFMEADATISTRELRRVLFDGINWTTHVKATG